MRLSSDVRAHARAVIARRLGLDFPARREEELDRRLIQASLAARATDTARYVARLETLPEDSPEWRQLASHLTVGETYFFRDPRMFSALEHEVLPSLIERRRQEGIRRLRIWSAGCASGEEPYSLAILVDRLLPDRSDWSVTILGTDVNPRALAAARHGTYREWSLRETAGWIRRRYFVPRRAGDFELVPAIRRLVTFAPLNLAEEAYPSLATNTGAMDLIVCRNVIMYFTREAQRATIGRLHRALVERGWLVVSPAEASAELLRPLEPISFQGAIAFRKDAASRVRHGAERASNTPPLASLPAAQPRPARPRPSPTSSPRRQPDYEQDATRLLEGARAEADRGNLDHARDLCREAVSRDRLVPEAHLLLAAIEQERGDIPGAIGAVRSAVYLAPDSPSAHFLLGSLLLRRGELEKARRTMRAVVSLLGSVPSDDVVGGGDGLTAGRLLETARAYLEAQ